MHLVEAGGRSVLLDCGLFQGHRAEAAAKNRNLRVDGSRLDAVILSHAHIDHSGNIPTLYKSGFRGRVHATRATSDLTDLMLRDSAQVQLRDIRYLRRRKESPFEPLYTASEVRAVVRRFRSWDYGTWFDVVPGVRCRFLDAGHILGSASVHLEIREQGRDLTSLTFTGDFGRPNMPILRDPEPLPSSEIIITESTYGNRLHGEGSDAASQMKTSLKQALLAALQAGGKLIIPAFSVGRTQNILWILNEIIAEGSVPRTRVFVDSPLSAEATEVVCRHPECFDGDMLERLERSIRPVLAPHVELCRTVEESKRINRLRGTCVVIAASGMCEFGRILHHLKHNLEDDRAVIAFVGYQAEHTLGRRIVEGRPRVRIYGREVPVRARVVKLNGFSAHADRDELLAALRPLKSAAGRVFIVHGEENQALPLAETLSSEGFRGVEVPHEGDVVEI
jgi:metallo-beta-lactamase family protein